MERGGKREEERIKKTGEESDGGGERWRIGRTGDKRGKKTSRKSWRGERRSWGREVEGGRRQQEEKVMKMKEEERWSKRGGMQ